MIYKFLYSCFCFFIFSCFQANAAETFIHTEEAILSQKTPPSLHVLIVTIGRGTLIRMLESLQPQLESQDFLTVVFDGRDDAGVYEQVVNYLTAFKCTCSIWMEPVNTGFWGHVLHNKYNQLPGDFILHADDDDIYTVDAMDAIRYYCKDSDTLYIFRMLSYGRYLWWRREIIQNEIGKPMGVIPSKYNSLGLWGYNYGGDYEFYKSLEGIVPRIEFIDHLIYLVRP